MDGIVIKGLEAPETCSECFLRMPPTLIAKESNLYKYVSRCSRAPDSIKDPWRDIMWQLDHKEDFCPIFDAKDIEI